MRFLRYSIRMMTIACMLMMSLFVSACSTTNGAFDQAYSDSASYGTPGTYSRTIFSSHNF